MPLSYCATGRLHGVREGVREAEECLTSAEDEEERAEEWESVGERYDLLPE